MVYDFYGGQPILVMSLVMFASGVGGPLVHWALLWSEFKSTNLDVAGDVDYSISGSPASSVGQRDINVMAPSPFDRGRLILWKRSIVLRSMSKSCMGTQRGGGELRRTENISGGSTYVELTGRNDVNMVNNYFLLFQRTTSQPITPLVARSSLRK